jgi:serine/threonine-protein kinase
LSLVTAALLAFQSYLAREHEQGLAQCRRVVDLDPNHFLGRWSLGLALQALGRFREAVMEHRRAFKLSSRSPLMQAVLARSLALSGQRSEAGRLLASLDRASRESGAGLYASATVHLALGDEEKALDRLEAATGQRDPWLVWLNVDPMLDALRGHRRFQALAQRVYGARQGALPPPRKAPPRKRRL